MLVLLPKIAESGLFLKTSILVITLLRVFSQLVFAIWRIAACWSFVLLM